MRGLRSLPCADDVGDERQYAKEQPDVRTPTQDYRTELR